VVATHSGLLLKMKLGLNNLKVSGLPQRGGLSLLLIKRMIRKVENRDKQPNNQTNWQSQFSNQRWYYQDIGAPIYVY